MDNSERKIPSVIEKRNKELKVNIEHRNFEFL